MSCRERCGRCSEQAWGASANGLAKAQRRNGGRAQDLGHRNPQDNGENFTERATTGTHGEYVSYSLAPSSFLQLIQVTRFHFSN